MPIGHSYYASSHKDREEAHSRSLQHPAEKKRLQLERKLAASQLAHELAHEIDNPLEALTNLLYLLSRLAATPEGAQDAIYSKKLDGTIMACTSSEALGKSIRMLVPKDLPDDERIIMEKLRRGLRIESYETTRVTKKEKLARVSVTVSPILNASGRVVGASTIAREIAPPVVESEGMNTLKTRRGKSWIQPPEVSE